MKKRIMPTLGKSAKEGLLTLLNAVDLKQIVNNKEALAAYKYLQTLQTVTESEEYKERQTNKNAWIRNARTEGKYNSKGKI